MYHGWLNVDKPEGITSSQVISILRKIFSMRKIGHAGTLDPMATGVLPIAFGEATKTMKLMQDLEKEYCFTVKFGAVTDSLDRLGKIVATTKIIPSLEQVKSVLVNFIGDISQIPPKFSAIKVNGVRAYKKARQGEDIELDTRKVTVYKLELLDFCNDSAEASFRVLCSKGTYVRSLGRDIASSLGSLGHLIELRRTRVGEFTEDNIKSLEKIKQMMHNDKIRLLSVSDTFRDMPYIEFSTVDEIKIKNGMSVKISLEDRIDLNQKEAFAKVGSKLIAIGRIDNSMFRPTRGFNFN